MIVMSLFHVPPAHANRQPRCTLRSDTPRWIRPKQATLLTLTRKALSTFEPVACPPRMIALSPRSLKFWGVLIGSADLS